MYLGDAWNLYVVTSLKVHSRLQEQVVERHVLKFSLRFEMYETEDGPPDTLMDHLNGVHTVFVAGMYQVLSSVCNIIV